MDLVADQLTPISSTTLNPDVQPLNDRVQVLLKNNELILQYALPNLEDFQYYMVTIEASFNNEDITPDKSQLIGSLGKIKTLQKGGEQIIWKDIINSVPNAKGQLGIYMKSGIMGRFKIEFWCGLLQTASIWIQRTMAILCCCCWFWRVIYCR